MKTYTKTHTNKKAADIHLDRIKKRGGTANVRQTTTGILIEYSFPEKPGKKQPAKKSAASKTKKSEMAGSNKMLYDILSPDGFTIRMPGDELFKTRQEGMTYFKKWKKRYEAQGYYSSNYGRIALIDLADECSWEEVPANKADSWLGFKMR